MLRAASARWDGVHTLAGRLPRSRARSLPAATALPTLMPVRTSLKLVPLLTPSASFASRDGGSVLLLSSSKRYTLARAASTLQRAASAALSAVSYPKKLVASFVPPPRRALSAAPSAVVKRFAE